MIYRFFLTLINIALILLFSLQNKVKAQKNYEGVLYSSNSYYQNPAYTGKTGQIALLLNYRSAASTIEGMPKQVMFGVHSPIYNNMGLGLKIENYSEGLFNYFTGYVNYAYHLKINRIQNLHFGISFGYAGNSLDYAKIAATDPSAVQEIANKYFTGNQFISAAGIVYVYKTFEVSLASPMLYGTGKSFNPTFTSLIKYSFDFHENQIILTPYLYGMYSKDLPFLYDIIVIADYKEKFQLGIGYRNRNSIIISTGVKFSNFSINYAADIGFNKLTNIYNLLHEVSITYGINPKLKTIQDSIYNLPLIVKNDTLNTTDTNHIEKQNNLKTDIIAQNTDTLNNQNIKITDENTETINKKSDIVTDNADEKNVFTEHKNNIDKTQDIKNKKVSEKNVSNIEMITGIYTLDNNSDNKVESIDSLIAKMNINKNNGYAEELTSGIYDIKTKNGNTQTNEDIDLIIADMDIKINKPEIEEEDEFMNQYFSILINFKKSTSAINKNPNLLENIDIIKRSNGTIRYTYGKFLTKKEADKEAYKLKKIGFAVINVDKLGKL